MRKLTRCKKSAVQMDKNKASWRLDELDGAQTSLKLSGASWQTSTGRVFHKLTAEGLKY